MMLQTKNLTKKFGGIIAVNNCSINVSEAQITSLIGPNGAGKTTLFNLIAGTIKPDNGKVLLEGRDIAHLQIHERAKRGISRTFQLTRIFKNMNVRDNLLLAQKLSDSQLQNFLSQFKLEKHLNTLAGSLSYGQQRLLELARALLLQHALLMLDEPTAGVSPFIRNEMKKLLKKLKNQGKTILLIEHDMEFVMNVSDKVIVLNEGKILAEGRPNNISKNAKVLEAYLGK